MYPYPFDTPKKVGEEGGGGLRVSAVGTSSPQKLLEAVTALFSEYLAEKYLKSLNRVSSDTRTCAAQKFACKFTLNLQTLSVKSKGQSQEIFVDDPCVKLD